MTLRVAFYKAEGNLMNGLIRFWDAGPYSHCELAFSDGTCASASFRDGMKVRAKAMALDLEHWDVVTLPDALEVHALQFLKETAGQPYDLFGQLRFFVSPYKGADGAFWCSEWVAAALGMPEPWRYGPNGLHAALAFTLGAAA